MPRPGSIPPDWKQISVPVPKTWDAWSEAVQEEAKAKGEIISLQEAWRRLIRAGAQAMGLGEPADQ